jgi:hypothetical protein
VLKYSQPISQRFGSKKNDSNFKKFYLKAIYFYPQPGEIVKALIKLIKETFLNKLGGKS